MSSPLAWFSSARPWSLSLVGLAATWSSVLLYFLANRPLWLDELIHANVASASLQDFLPEVAKNPGATPITYAPHAFLFHFFGYSSSLGRAVSYIAFLGSVVLLWRLLCVFGRTAAIAGTGIFLTLPLISRYAIELRPYLLLVFFSLALHFIYRKLLLNESRTLTTLYAIVSILAVLTLPIALAVPLSHITFELCSRLTRPRPRIPGPRLYGPLIGIAVPVLCLLPWHHYASSTWQTTIREIGSTGQISLSVLLLIIRELTGAGYLGFVLLISLLLLSLSSKSFPLSEKLFWLIAFLVPIGFAIFVDSLFGYFFAIRQVIASLAPLCVLVGIGLSHLHSRKPRLAVTLTVVAILLQSVYSFNWLAKQDENWAVAADQAIQFVKPSGCIVLMPNSTVPYSEFIHPELAESVCDIESALDTQNRIVIVDSDYGETDANVISLVKNARDRFRIHDERRVGRFRIEVLDR
ncbi:MAG: hypothetical protein MUF01_17445 [Bryobacterales bacterium]|jgi:hypothetical protein|nr:hypothetical protein [Bryobacterales bacterium]